MKHGCRIHGQSWKGPLTNPIQPLSSFNEGKAREIERLLDRVSDAPARGHRPALSDPSWRHRITQQRFPPPQPLTPEESTHLGEALRLDLEQKQRTAAYTRMVPFRQRLPAWSEREHVLEAVRRTQVIVISGETGCGKTTQVPQFILDDALASGRGADCNIICTQPRRISATSVARRVAEERGEACGGADSSTGFHIRLESARPRQQGSITFCTVGILLRRLIGDPKLQGISHIILDEIHERDILSDSLLVILRDMLPTRPDMKVRQKHVGRLRDNDM